MKTDSIRDILEMKFGFKDNYLESELDTVKTININRFNIVNELNNIDFNELLLFKNLKELIINKCIIDENIMNILIRIPSLDYLVLNNCEFVDEPKFLFDNINIRFLVIDNTLFDLKILKNCNLDTLVLSNINISYGFDLNVKKLDIRKCKLLDYEFLNNSIETIVVSEKQYINSEILQNYIYHMVIMENNGQMIRKEVNKNGYF